MANESSLVNLSNGTYSPVDDMNSTSALPHGSRGIFHILIPVINCTISLSGLIANGIVLLMILRRKSMKTVPNMYILNLASADFLFLIDLIFLTLPYVTKHWSLGVVMCKIVQGIDGMNMFTGIFTLTAMSVDRYLAIVHAVWSKNHRTVFQARVVCIILWLLSIAVTIPLWMYSETRTYPNGVQCNFHGSPMVEYSFAVYSFAIGFVLPIVVISICYTGILVYLARNAKRGKKHGQKTKSKIGRVSLMILMAVVVFVICWLPFWSIRVYILTAGQSGGHSMALQIFYYLSQCLTYANSSLNPLVYAYFKQDFRRTPHDETRTH